MEGGSSVIVLADEGPIWKVTFRSGLEYGRGIGQGRAAERFVVRMQSDLIHKETPCCVPPVE